MLRTINALPYPHFLGFYNYHIPYSYLKSTYKTLWNKESELLSTTCSHRFREVMDLNHWIFSYWQFVTGNFAPRSTRFGINMAIHNTGEARKAKAIILNGNYKVICTNDTVEPNQNFEEIVYIVNSALHKILGSKSEFEL